MGIETGTLQDHALGIATKDSSMFFWRGALRRRGCGYLLLLVLAFFLFTGYAAWNDLVNAWQAYLHSTLLGTAFMLLLFVALVVAMLIDTSKTRRSKERDGVGGEQLLPIPFAARISPADTSDLQAQSETPFG